MDFIKLDNVKGRLSTALYLKSSKLFVCSLEYPECNELALRKGDSHMTFFEKQYQGIFINNDGCIERMKFNQLDDVEYTFEIYVKRNNDGMLMGRNASETTI